MEIDTLELAKQLIARRSVSPDDAGCLDMVIGILAPLGFTCEKISMNGVDNLWARRGTAAPLVCFAGHTDVVPTGPLEQWQSDPFTPTIRVCQRFAFGKASLEDGKFTPSVEFSKLEAMNQCEGMDTVGLCRAQLCTGYCGTGHFALAPMCVDAYGSNEERGCAPIVAPDAGDGDGGGDMDASVTEEPASGSGGGGVCGVAAPGRSHDGGLAVLGGAAIAVLITRRRRRLNSLRE